MPPIPPPPRAASLVEGRVVSDSGQALAGAEVAVLDGGRSSTTDSGGRFSIGGLRAGTRRGVVRYIGYTPFFFQFSVGENDTLELEFVLRRLPVRLPDLTSRGRAPMKGDEALRVRTRAGGGQFLDEASLRARPAARLTDLLRELRGLRIGFDGTPLSTRGALLSGPCEVALFVDGKRLPADGFLRDVDPLRTDEVRLVEFYAGPSELPQEFGGTGSVCGALVIWLR
ncbi:MAG: carboxypeptidase regulatory-like domain-containing protein [Gemmatimonadetes bacterium]|nr:carboxypeptidase regulatory-like domain-containing protein [Gemmatimonadota bacterium]MCC7134655.1 carboxypeptidase regulatory-like domain-containing protein [Gemmatimonadales bacterium]